jgi:hypothetical protein
VKPSIPQEALANELIGCSLWAVITDVVIISVVIALANELISCSYLEHKLNFKTNCEISLSVSESAIIDLVCWLAMPAMLAGSHWHPTRGALV